MNPNGMLNSSFSRNPNLNASLPPYNPRPYFNNNNNDNNVIANSALPSGSFGTSNLFTFTSVPQNNNPENLNLDETIRAFKELISHAETTANQVLDLVKLNQSDFSSDLSVCPFDSRHRMQPEHLFRHSLCCPASPSTVDLDILSTLRYPRTVKSDKQQTQLFELLPCSESDLCISIEAEDEGALESDFFYKDAPGAVNSTQREIRKTFTLPRVLSVECVDLTNSNENIWSSGNDIVILPSEFCALRTELAEWNNLPLRYSSVALATAAGLGRVKESKIVKWIMLNSPVYGIIIDLPMAQHIMLLLKLCLKAVSREAIGTYQREKEKKDESKMDIDTSIKTMSQSSSLRTTYFDCPVLCEIAEWLSSQMSILYGLTCSKGFVIALLRHSFTCASTALSYPAVHKEQAITKALQDLTCMSSADDSVEKVNANGEVLDGTNNANVKKNRFRFSCDMASEVGNEDKSEHGDGLILESRVCVFQIAAAVAALQERFFLEERIRGLRHSSRLSKFQLLAEHNIAVKKAAEERERRMNYKPILEHDGLVWQRSSNQDSKRWKSREELLAEERDYKRRRMSYRGKKVKRTPSQVLHDIIEGHMEEIKIAGGIGCFVKGVSETPHTATESIPSEGHMEEIKLAGGIDCFVKGVSETTSQIETESIPSDSVAGSMQQSGSTDSFISNKGESFSFRSNQPMQFDSMTMSSKRLDVGKMDLQRKRFSRSGSPHMPSQNYFDDHNRLDKHKHHKRNDYAQDDGNSGRYSEKLFHYDDIPSYSGSHAEKLYMRGHETRHDSRYLDRNTDTCYHEERTSRKSHHKHESRQRNRSHERKHSDSSNGDGTGGSSDRYETAHHYDSYEGAHRSKEHRRRSNIRDR